MAEMHSLRVAMPADHPAFAGHFPGAPVLPGVVLLSELMEALLAQQPPAIAPGAQVGAVKFNAPVRPGADLDLRWQQTPGGRLRFEVWRFAPDDGPAGVLAASGQIDPAPAP